MDDTQEAEVEGGSYESVSDGYSEEERIISYRQEDTDHSGAEDWEEDEATEYRTVRYIDDEDTEEEDERIVTILTYDHSEYNEENSISNNPASSPGPS